MTFRLWGAPEAWLEIPLKAPQNEKMGHEDTSIHYCQWLGLRENLQETIDFPMKYGVFL